MDDLQSLVERNVSGREAEARQAERILRSELGRFDRWLAAQDVTPTIAALRERADEVVERVLAENDERWEGLTDADRERLQTAARAIASRLLHEPTLRLKRDAGEPDAYNRVDRAARAVRPRSRQRAARVDGDRSPTCTSGASASAATVGERAPARDARQHPGADPGRGGRRGPRRRGGGHCAHRRRRGRRQGPLRARGRAGDPRRRGRPRRALRQGPSRRAARGPGAGRRPRARGPHRRVHRSRRIARRARRGRPGRDLEPAPRARSCSRCAPTSRSLELRGNVDTRLAKLAEGGYDGIVLASAGLARLGRAGEVSFRFGLDELTPAAGQGCLALEARADDQPTAAAAGGITDRDALVELTAERAAVPGAGRRAATPRSGSALAPPRASWSCSATPGSPTAASGFATGSPAIPTSRRRSASRWPSGCSPPGPARSSPARAAERRRFGCRGHLPQLRA